MAFTSQEQRTFSEEQITGALVERSAHVQRTLIVGLGGTGGEVIKRLKQRLRRLGKAATHIRFLSLDTDVRTWLASAHFPALEPRERVPLSHPNPENVLEAPHLYPAVQHLFQMGAKLDLSLLADANGAGLMPVIGRTAFHLNAAGVYAHLQRALRDLQALSAEPIGQPLAEEFRIYVVGSVAGGTGAGTVVETAVMLRHLFKSFKYQLIGLLVLPEAFAPTLRGQQLDAQSRGNAYAVLKELQYLQDGPAHWDDPESYTFRFQIGGDLRTVPLTERLFNILYMVDNQNQEGAALRNLGDVYEMVAQQLSVEIGSPFGAKFASAQANDRAIMGLSPCRETGRPANISSLATAALIVPEEKLLHYCCDRFLRDAIREHLIGSDPQPEEIDAAVQAWFAASGLEERGGRRMLQQAFLTDMQGGRELTGAEFATDAEAYLSRGSGEFLAAMRSQEEHFTAQGMVRVRLLIERTSGRSRQELPERLQALLETAFVASGIHGVAAYLRSITAALDEAIAQLVRQMAEGESARDSVRASLIRDREQLAGRGLLRGLFGGSKEKIRRVASLQADLMQVELDQAACTGALRLLEEAKGLCEEQRRRLDGVEHHLVRLLQGVEGELLQQRWSGESSNGYALETEVIRPADYPTCYTRLCPDAGETLREALGADGSLAALGRIQSELAPHLTRTARKLFRARIGSLNVVDLLQEHYSRPAAFALLDDLARRCRPFWTAAPRGGSAFSDVFLIGSPGVHPGGHDGPVQAEPLLQEWVESHAGGGAGLQSSPTYVALGSPGAIIFSRQTHGARLHYMRQLADYRDNYRALFQQRGYPVHFKACLEGLPELCPDDERSTEAWALSVAYGMAAAKSFGWVWALDFDRRREGQRERLLTGSLWDLAAEIAPVDKQELAPHSGRFLHATRAGALSQLGQRRDWAAAVERLVARRLDAMGRQAMTAELCRYLDEVISPRLNRDDDPETTVLAREYAGVRRFLERINL